MLLDNILGLAKKHSFFTPILSNNCKNVLSYQLGPSGSLFQDNIKSEWIYSNVVNRDTSVFLHTKNDCENLNDNEIYSNVKQICDNHLPFGVAKIFTESVAPSDNMTLTENNYFSTLINTILSTQMFMPPSEGMHFFFHWQRQRKLWWKKISAFPGRFLLGEVSKSPTDTSVPIIANFSWGDQIIETISISQMDESNSDLKARFGRKSVLPMIIKSEMSLDSAVVSLFCDAFDEDSVHKTPVLRIHRKLAPYKCIFAAESTDASTSEELAQLAFYLTKQLRNCGISSLCLPDCTKISPSQQFQRNDEWGIPFTVILNADSLRSGIINLRSRDTTLKEEVHVTDLSSYVQQLFKCF